MKRIAKSLDSLKDSRIMFEKQPPAFGYVLIFIVSIFFIDLIDAKPFISPHKCL